MSGDASATWRDEPRDRPGRGAGETTFDTPRDGGVSGANGDTEDTGAAGPFVSIVLPPRLAARFRVIRELDNQGAEGVVVLAEEIETYEQRVVKLYKNGVELHRDAVDVLREISDDPEGRRHVVRLYEAVREEDRWYEVQEYYPEGSLRDVLLRADADVSPHRIVEEVGAALAHIEGRVRLRDVKPENLMVRSLAPLDVVLADFGLARSARDGPYRLTEAAGTPAYQPPEAAEDRLTDGWDWWSLGMIVAEVAVGRHPLAYDNGELPPAPHIRSRIRDHAVDVSGVEDERLRTLCRGLLVRDYSRRWRRDQLTAWLAGEAPPVPDDEGPLRFGTSTAPRDSTTPVQFAGAAYRSPADLAGAFQAHWPYAIERLFVDRNQEWIDGLEAMLRECELLGAAQTVSEGLGAAADASVKLAMLLLDMSPDIDPVFDGMRLTPDGMREAADDVLAGRRNGARLDEVRRSGVLLLWRSVPGIANAERIVQHWDAGAERIEQLVEGLQQAVTLDQAASDRAKALLLVCLLSSSHRDEMMAEIRRDREGAAGETRWWRNIADEGIYPRRESLPAAALASITEHQASMLALERPVRDVIGERADRVDQRESEELERFRHADDSALAGGPDFLPNLRFRRRRRHRRRSGPRRRPGGWSGEAVPAAAPALVTVVGVVLVACHLWLLSQYGERLRDLFAPAGAPELQFVEDLVRLDDVDQWASPSVWAAVLAVAAHLVGRHLVARVARADLSLAARLHSVVTSVLQALLMVVVVLTGRIYLVLGRSANGAEAAGLGPDHLPPWLEAADLIFAVVAVAAGLAIVAAIARVWRNVWTPARSL